MKTPKTVDAAPPLTPEEIHAAFVAGWDAGHAVGRQAASADLARALLHEQACAMAGLAVSTASAKGPAWADAIREQGAAE